jgi:hypothetical protein
MNKEQNKKYVHFHEKRYYNELELKELSCCETFSSFFHTYIFYVRYAVRLGEHLYF